MSAQLFFSNSPAVLLDRLSDNLDWSDPFRSPRIATPTPAMKRWVQLRLAEKSGIVANVEFLQLERMLWKRLEALDLEHVVEGRKPARLLDEMGLQLLILALLRADPPDEARAYLEAGGHERLRIPRLCQLSRKLAGFFREYEYARVQEHGHMGLAHLWMFGKDCFTALLPENAPAPLRKSVAELESWQKRIYHGIFKQGGLRDTLGEAQGQYRYTLPQYAEMVLSQPRKPADPSRVAPEYHLFGLSQISPFHRSLIQRLADRDSLQGRHARFHIYSLNPCAEYWEDVLTPGERLRQQGNLFRQKKYVGWRDLGEEEKARLRLPEEAIRAEELHLEENENPLLSRWGKPGRENIQLWCQVTGYAFSEYFREAGNRSLLATVQDSVLHRRGRLPDGERAPQDASLKILACPEIHREAETAYQGILEALRADPSLRPDDIAVLVPDMDKYRHVLAAVFGRAGEGEAGHLPFTLSDASASSESDYARAVRQVFALATGRFSRKEMFALAANPCFRAGPDAAAPDLRAWGDWATRLNIFHGFDAEDRAGRGYAPDASHTWAQGLDRLVLGTVMEAPGDDDLRHFGDIVPYSDGHSADREALAGFLALVRGLHRDLAPLREEGAKTWAEWLDRCETVFERYLDAPEEQPLESYVRAELRRYLTELRAMDAMGRLARAEAGVEFQAPMDLILARLETLKAGREPHLSGGVNVAALGALRSLPFRIIHVLGLGEGEFPEADPASNLDLRRTRRVIGDVDPAGRNRYLFLETLLCASGSLQLSYVSRDMQLGKTFQMGSVLSELVDYLEDCVLPSASDGKPSRFRVVQVPLLSRDPSLFDPERNAPWDPPPNPFREDKVLAWLEGRRAAVPGFARGLRALAPPAAVRDILPLPMPPPRTGLDDRVAAMPLDEMRMFLENPARHALRKRLGIRDNRDEDALDEEDEPFFCPQPLDLDLIRRAGQRALAGVDGTREQSRRWFGEAYGNLALRGMMPAEPFRTLDGEKLWERVDALLEGVDQYKAMMAAPARGWERMPALVLGDGGGYGTPVRTPGMEPLRMRPITLRAAGREPALHGELPSLFRAADGSCSTLVIMTGEFKPRFLLPAFLFYAAGLLSDSPAGEWLRGGPFCIHYVSQQKRYKPFEIGNWAPFRLDPDKARAWLTGLAEDMLGGTGFDLLPFDVIARVLAPQRWLARGVDYAQALRDELEFEDDAPAFFSSPVPESQQLLDPRVPDDAEAKIRARLEPFFNFIPDEGHDG